MTREDPADQSVATEFTTLAILLHRMKRNPPAKRHVLKDFAETLDVALPRDYFVFLLYANGAEGPIGRQYIELWPVEDLLAANQEYTDSELSKGFFFFGSDGAGEGFAFDLRLKRPVICRVPFMGLEPGSAEPLGVSFHEFLESLLRE
jgi:hypothetical protein